MHDRIKASLESVKDLTVDLLEAVPAVVGAVVETAVEKIVEVLDK